MEAPLQIDVVEAARLAKQSGHLLLDVREPHEVAFCQIPGSLHIPMGSIPERLPELSREQAILVICHHGGRSMRVTQFLRANNYPKGTNVAGGIDAWAEMIEPGMTRY